MADYSETTSIDDPQTIAARRRMQRNGMFLIGLVLLGFATVAIAVLMETPMIAIGFAVVGLCWILAARLILPN